LHKGVGTGKVGGITVFDGRSCKDLGSIRFNVHNVCSGEIIRDKGEFFLNPCWLEERCDLTVGRGEVVIIRRRVALSIGLEPAIMNDEDACLTRRVPGNIKEMNVVLSKDHNWFVPIGKGSRLDVIPSDFRRYGRPIEDSEVESIQFAVRESIEYVGVVVKDRID